MTETTETQNSETQATPTPEAGVVSSLVTETTTTAEATTTETATEEAKAEVVEVVPLTVEDIVLPEGFAPAPELQQEFVDVMNDADLSAKDRASALIALQAKALTAASEASSAAWTEMQDKWRTEVKADPAFSGEKLTTAVASVAKLISEYGTPELNGVFDLTGAGNNIHVIKFLSNIAGKLTEGSFTAGSPAGGEASAASLLYPSMKG